MRTARHRLRRTAFAALPLALVLAGCATPTMGGDDGTIPQNALNPAPGSPALAQDDLWNLVFPIALAVFVLVQGLIVFALWKFRARPDDDPARLPKQVAGNTRLEILWTLIPALILAGVAVPTVATIFDLAGVDEDALAVRVIGKQYWWEFEYVDPDTENVVTATTLHIPTGREVRLDMVSVDATQPYEPEGEDGETVVPQGAIAQGVIHSFWVPGLAGKLDVVPGHVRTMKISTDEAGTYIGQCAEFCGLSHPNMRFTVEAHDPSDFDAWIADQAEPASSPDDALASEGEELFATQQCTACHAVDGHPSNAGIRTGPNLTHFNGRETFAGGILDVDDDEALAAWLRDPQAEKPGSQMPNLGLTEEQVDALLAYLRTLD